MPEVDRRRFLQLAGGSAALSVLTPSIARAASIPAIESHRLHQRRRAHRRADAGEPLVRPLLRDHARRPRVRRPAPRRDAQREAGLASAHRQEPEGRGAPLPAQARRPRPEVPPGHRPRVGQPARGVRRREPRPVGAGQGHPRDHGPPAARRHPVPLRAGRRLHPVRRLPLQHARPDRPEPLLPVVRLGRQRRQGRWPGGHQHRAWLQLAYLPRAAPGRRRGLEDLPGPRPGTRRGAQLGVRPRRLRRHLR